MGLANSLGSEAAMVQLAAINIDMPEKNKGDAIGFSELVTAEALREDQKSKHFLEEL